MVANSYHGIWEGLKMYRLKIQQAEHITLGKWFEYTLIDLRTNEIIEKDSIDDIGQGMDKATEQIHAILNNRHGFKL